MNRLRVLFMGTPEFAVGILKELLTSQVNVVGVVTAPDKPSGRGKKLSSSAVKQYAGSKSLEVLQPTNLKSESFQEDLNRLDPQLIIVVAFRMLPKVVWDYPSHGTFNLHASLLPEYRGAAPINWAIINGEQKTGVTTFFIDEDIDTGKIINQRSISIAEDDNVETLHDKLMTLGAELVVETVSNIEQGKVDPKIQLHNTSLKSAPKLTKENTKIDWNKKGKDIVNFVRGLTPFPTAWTELQMNTKTIKVKVYEVNSEVKQHSAEIGSSYFNKELKCVSVAVSDGYVHIKELQFPGKKRMEAHSLVNGMGWEKEFKFV